MLKEEPKVGNFIYKCHFDIHKPTIEVGIYYVAKYLNNGKIVLIQKHKDSMYIEQGSVKLLPQAFIHSGGYLLPEVMNSFYVDEQSAIEEIKTLHKAMGKLIDEYEKTTKLLQKQLNFVVMSDGICQDHGQDINNCTKCKEKRNIEYILNHSKSF